MAADAGVRTDPEAESFAGIKCPTCAAFADTLTGGGRGDRRRLIPSHRGSDLMKR
jgi:hypothetical protein